MTSHENITAAILLIGNELLSGRTQDKNVAFIARHLKECGIPLLEVRMIPDKEDAIIHHVNFLSKAYTYLFTTGGIGSTHDDITTASIAKCFGCELVLNQEILDILKEHYGNLLNENRKRFAYIPSDVSALIPNPISMVPSYQIRNVFVFAGMPSIMQEMFLSIKDRLKKGPQIKSQEIKTNLLEGDIADQLASIQALFPEVDIGSYPYYNEHEKGTHFVATSANPEKLKEAFEAIEAMCKEKKAVCQKIS